MDKNRALRAKIPMRQKICLVFFGLAIFFILLEIGLNFGAFLTSSLQEHRNRILMGQRGVYRIMCLGESTTAGGEKTYPSQLQEILNQSNMGIKFIVINKGKGGIDTSVILSNLEDNLSQCQPDMVTAMMGINDEPHYIPYDIITTSKPKNFFKSFRSYKLMRLLWLYIVTTFREMGIAHPKEAGNISQEKSACQMINSSQDDGLSKEMAEPDPRELARIYREEGRFSEAEEAYKKAIQLHPEDVSAYLELGFFYGYQYKSAQAEEMFKKALELKSNDTQIYADLGCLYLGWGKLSQAEEVLEKALELDLGNKEACNNLGWAYENQRKYPQAEEMFKKILELDPNDIATYKALGWIYRNQGKISLAEEMLKKAYKLNSQDERLGGGLASIYQEKGEYKLAEKFYRESNELRSSYYNPKTRENYQKLKQVLDKRGIKLVCIQYPVLSVEPLKKMLQGQDGIVLVDNEKVFKEALKAGSYKEYFTDMFGGEFGHCTPKGDRLLAENIAKVIIKECVKK